MSIPAPESVDLWHSAVLAYKDWRRRRALMSELDALGCEEAEKVLRECGLTHDELASAIRHRSAALLPDALRAVGVDLAAVQARHAAWNRDLTRTCMLCSKRGRCSNELAASRFASSYREFCPNRDSIDELKRIHGTKASA